MPHAKRKDMEREIEIVRRQGRGVLRAKDVVEYARDPETALHGEFEWDDAKAGHEYRLEQARKLIRVHVTVLREDVPPVRAYVSLRKDRKQPGGGYRSITNVMRNKKMRAALLAEAFAEMERFQEKYAVLKELAPVFTAMQKVKKPDAKVA